MLSIIFNVSAVVGFLVTERWGLKGLAWMIAVMVFLLVTYLSWKHS